MRFIGRLSGDAASGWEAGFASVSDGDVAAAEATGTATFDTRDDARAWVETRALQLGFGPTTIVWEADSAPS